MENCKKTSTAEEARALTLGDHAEDINDSLYCQSSDFEDEVAAAALVDLAVGLTMHVQFGTSGRGRS